MIKKERTFNNHLSDILSICMSQCDQERKKKPERMAVLEFNKLLPLQTPAFQTPSIHTHHFHYLYLARWTDERLSGVD